MTNLSRIILILLGMVSFLSYDQISIQTLHYRSKIDRSELYFKDTLTNHSSVLPIITNTYLPHSKAQLSFAKLNVTTASIDGPGSIDRGRIYPLVNLGLGGEYMKNATDNPKYTVGAGVGMDLAFGNFYFTAKVLPYTTYSPFVQDSIQRNFSMDIGTTRPISDNWFQRSEILLAYKTRRYFTFMGGYGKNFFGEGYRSLLLSDNASNYPFFKLETEFGNIKYVNLYTIWNDNPTNPANKNLDRMKFSAMHYLSWNITREFNLSVFESVVWQAKDTLVNRGLDVSYLNPIVFYRPVEYANGSSDNVLLGLNMSFKFTKNHVLYSQLLLDEFLLSELKSKSQWWGNKYGIQFGYKSNAFFIENLYFQTEFNMARPFTYSHKNSILSYGHLNAGVAHPLGGNFFEVLNIISYQLGEHRITNKITYASFGIDTDSISYGQNIFASYSDRNGNYGHKTMQGSRQSVLNETIIFETPLIEKIQLYINITYNYRMHYNAGALTHSHLLMFGIRSRLWNSYSDI